MITHLFLIISCSFSFDVRIIHTNDLHSQFSGTGPDSDFEKSKGGYSRISYLINKLQKKYPESTLTVDAGDFFGGSMFHLMSGSDIFNFSPEFAFLDYWNYDAVAIGNHELDGGLQLLNEMIEKSHAAIPLVLTNSQLDLFETPHWHDYETQFAPPRCSEERVADPVHHSHNPYFVPFVLKELKNGDETLKVAIIGLVGPNSLRVTSRVNRQGVTSIGFSALLGENIDEYSYYVANMTKYIRWKFGVEFVISLSHSGDPEDLIFLNKLYKLSPDLRLIDVHISGHTHHQYYYQHKESLALTAQTEGYGMELGYLDIFFDKTTGKLVLKNEGEHLIPIDNSIPDDPEVTRKVEGYTKLLHSVFLENKNSEDDDDDDELLETSIGEVRFPVGLISSLKDREEILDWITGCIHNETNRVLRNRGDKTIDMFIFSHEFGRIDKEIAMKYENGTDILFSDIFRWFGVGTIEEPITFSNWMGEEVVTWYMKKRDIFLMVNVWQIAKNFVDYMNVSLGGITFETNTVGLPFVDHPRLGKYHSIRVFGELMNELPHEYVKVAARKSLCEFLREIPSAMSFGYAQLKSFDMFGRESFPISSKIKETVVFANCLKRLM